MSQSSILSVPKRWGGAMSSDDDEKERDDGGYSTVMNFVIGGVWLFLLMLALGVAIEGGW